MSTDPDTVRDNSGSLLNHRRSQTSSLSSASESGSGRTSSLRADHPAEGYRRRGLTTSALRGPNAAGGSSISSSFSLPRSLSTTLHAAATLNAAENKDAITSLTPKERKSVSLGAAGAGLSSTDEITTALSTFDFQRPDYTPSARRSHAAAKSPASASPRNTTSLGPNNGGKDNDGDKSNTISPMTSNTQQPATAVYSTSPASSLSKSPSERRRSAIAMNLALSDPTLPAPGELASSDRRASVSSSGMSPAYGYAQRTGSIAGSTGSPAGGIFYNRGASMGRGGSPYGSRRVSSALGGSTGPFGTADTDTRLRRPSAGTIYQQQEEEHQRMVLHLFSRIHALQMEVLHLRYGTPLGYDDIGRQTGTASPGTDSDNPVGTETDASAEEGDADTDSASFPRPPNYAHLVHPGLATASNPATAPGVNISDIAGRGHERAPSQPIAIPDPKSSTARPRVAGATPQTYEHARRDLDSFGSAGSWGTPPQGRPAPLTSDKRSLSSSYSPPAPGLAASTIPELSSQPPSNMALLTAYANANTHDANFWIHGPSVNAMFPPRSPHLPALNTRVGDAEYWESEANYLRRENQLLKVRNRELEKAVAELGGEPGISRSVSHRQSQGSQPGHSRSRGTSISELQLSNSPTRPLQPSSLSQVTPLEREEDDAKGMDLD